MKIKEGLFLNYRLINYLKGVNGGEILAKLTKIILKQAAIIVGAFIAACHKDYFYSCKPTN